MSDITLVMNNIKEALEMKKPSAKLILSYLDNFKEEYQHLSDSDFFDIIGETFKLNPKFFLDSLYPKIWQKIGKLYGDEGRRTMDRYIIEKFCLYNGEQILYECDGSIEQTLPNRYKISVQSGNIFVTNMRIIAQGKFRKAALTSGVGIIGILALVNPLEALMETSVGSERKTKGIKQGLIDSSVQQELPCYGYMFPIEKLFDLRKEKRTIIYKIILSYHVFRINISSSSFKTRENIDKLLEILSKKDTGRKLKEKTFCLKGRLVTIKKEQARKLIEALGGQVRDPVVVGKNLSYIVTNSTKTKAKYDKVQEHGTKIITEEEFLKIFE
ncbi:MAG: BRCT domain-containing protein [Candidatus Hodarchaeota archaeon]